MKSVSMLLDLSRLYFSQSRSTEMLDYGWMIDLLSKTVGQNFKLMLGFTAYIPSNTGQVKFVSYLKKIQIEVETVDPSEANIFPGSFGVGQDLYMMGTRFDSSIAFGIGRLAGYEDIVIISDSYSLCRPMIEAAKRGSTVYLGWFLHQLDPRWMTYLKAESPLIQFINLGNKTTQDQSELSRLP